MNIQITAIRTEAGATSDRDITHYQLLDLDSFSFATLPRPQVVAMVETGTRVTVASDDGQTIPCLVNTRSQTNGITEKWLQAQADGEWTDDISLLPRIDDINGAHKVRRFTRKVQQYDGQ